MTRAAPRDWDAHTYDRVSEPQVEWGAEVLDRLPLRGDETVLDAGCGSGRVTRLLIERLPRGHVVAVDASPSMVERARAVLRPGDRVLLSDLQELRLDAHVDAVFSSAVFHWIADHDSLFAALAAALRPGGRLVAQCGGQGNLERLHAVVRDICREEPFAPFFRDWDEPWNFASPEDTARRLDRAGFVDVRCSLEEREVRPPAPAAYLRTVCLGNHLDALPPGLRDAFVERVLGNVRSSGAWTSDKLDMTARRGSPRLDYVRLNISARRAAAT